MLFEITTYSFMSIPVVHPIHPYMHTLCWYWILASYIGITVTHDGNKCAFYAAISKFSNTSFNCIRSDVYFFQWNVFPLLLHRPHFRVDILFRLPCCCCPLSLTFFSHMGEMYVGTWPEFRMGSKRCYILARKITVQMDAVLQLWWHYSKGLNFWK